MSNEVSKVDNQATIYHHLFIMWLGREKSVHGKKTKFALTLNTQIAKNQPTTGL